MNFFFVREAELDSDNGASIVKDSRFDRLCGSMDICKGAEFRVAAEKRGRGTAVIESIGSSCVRASLQINDRDVCPVCLHLILAVPRPKVLSKLIPRLTSLGIASLNIVNAAGVKKEYFSTHRLEPDAVENMILEGIEQSGVFIRPVITMRRKLKPYIEDILANPADKEIRLLCSPGGAHTVIACSDVEQILIAIGPETGWTSFEMDMFLNAGFGVYSMGPEHLASDVAALSAVAGVKSAVVNGRVSPG